MSKGREILPLFEETILPHLNAAYNLARWIMGNEQDAEDMVQEACMRAYQYFDGYQGGNSRAWLLTIVRNTCYTCLRQNRDQRLSLELDEELAGSADPTKDPEMHIQLNSNHMQVRSALEKLPLEYRELIVLRELEEMSYKEIALVSGIPIGTVMSRLARARQQLKKYLANDRGEEGKNEL
jgi:RNA polymerase sigma-70 factor, ECF subfamily